MRVLFVTHAEKTHFLAMVPLAWAVHNAGHEVRVASQPELADVITRAGLTAVPVGTDHMVNRVLSARRMSGQQEPEFDFCTERPEKLTLEYLTWGYTRTVRWWWRMVNDSMTDDLVALCRTWKPDLVIWEPVTYAGALAARVCGAAHARFLWSVDVFARMRAHHLDLLAQQPETARLDPLRSWLRAHAARQGVDFAEELTTGHFTIDYLPPALRLDSVPDLNYVPLRYVPYNGRAVVEPWLRQAPAKPRVCLTLGTTATERFGGYAVSVQDILDSLSDLEIEVVATVPKDQQDQLRHVPANAKLVTFAPLQALAPTCAAVINHGGPGTVGTVMSHAVPQLILPAQFDEPLIARHLTAQGAGLALSTEEATGARVRESLLRLLTEPSFRDGAVRLRDEVRGMPSPADVVPELERLTEEHRSTGAGANR